jgi:HPt (histidine-containing phosphotransfer) domain-containing protein
MDDFLTKPFSETQMAEALRRWLTPVERAVEALPQSPESAAGRAAAPAIDASAFSEMRMFKGPNGEARLKRIIAQFAIEAPALSETIREAYAEGNRDAVWRAAHTLKSSSAMLGAMQLSSRCATIEVVARDKGLGPVRQDVEALDGDLAAAIAGLETYMEQVVVAA